MVRITISIPEDIKAKLEVEAQEQDRSMAWLAREILQNYFKGK